MAGLAPHAPICCIPGCWASACMIRSTGSFVTIWPVTLCVVVTMSCETSGLALAVTSIELSRDRRGIEEEVRRHGLAGKYVQAGHFVGDVAG